MIDNILIQDFASQGQKRVVMLAFKLCLADYIYEIIGTYPILLLDDVMSELDNFNKKSLLDYLKDKIQTIITTTHIDDICEDINEIGAIFKIENGNIRKEGN